MDVYLVTMDSNGLEISREKKYTDTYKAAAPRPQCSARPRAETPMPDVPKHRLIHQQKARRILPLKRLQTRAAAAAALSALPLALPTRALAAETAPLTLSAC
ncbi:MAG: hypothetical protein ACLUN5_08080 [Oscillospiraceae bacterium]